MPKKKQNPVIPDENKIQKNIQKEKKPRAPPKPRQKKQKQQPVIDEPKIQQVQEIVPQPVQEPAQKPVPKPKPNRKRQKKSPTKIGSPIVAIQSEEILKQNQKQVNKSFQSDKSLLNKSFQDPSKLRITFEHKRNQETINKQFYEELSSVIQKINKPKPQKKTLLQIIEEFQHTPTYLNLKQLEDNFFGQIANSYQQQGNQGKQYISQVKAERFQQLPEQEYKFIEEYIPEESDDENPFAQFNTDIHQHIKKTDEQLYSTQQRKLFLYKLSKYKIRYDLGLLNRKKKKQKSEKLQEIQIDNPYHPPTCVAKIEYLLEIYDDNQQDSKELDDSIGLENSKHGIFRIISSKKKNLRESKSESEQDDSDDDYQDKFKIQLPELKLEYNQLYKKPKVFYDAQRQQIEIDMVQDTILAERKSSIIKMVQEKIASQKMDDEKSKQLKQLLDNKKIQLNQKRSVLINQAKQSALEVQEVEIIQDQQKSNQLNKEQQNAQHTQNQIIQYDQQKQIQQDKQSNNQINNQNNNQKNQHEMNKNIQKQEKKQQQIIQINNQIMTQQPIKNNNTLVDLIGENLRFDDYQPNGSLKNLRIEGNQKQQLNQNKQFSSPIKRQKNNAIDFIEQDRNKPKNQKDKELRENQFIEKISSGIFQTNTFLAKCEAISNDKDKKFGSGFEVMSGCEYKKESNRNKISNSKNRFKERTKSDDYPNQKQKYQNLSPDIQQLEQQKIKPEKQDVKAYESLWIRKPKNQLQEGRKSEGSKQEDAFNFIIDQFEPDIQIKNNKEVKQLKDYLQNRNSGTWAQESRISDISERKSHFRLFNKDSYNWVIFSSNSIKIGSPYVIKDVTNIDCWQILNIIAPQECFMKYEYFIVSDNFKIFFIEECDIMSFKVYEYIKSGQDQKAAQEVKNLLNNVIKLIYYQHKGQTCLVAYYTTQLFEIIMKDRVFDIFPELQNKLNFMMFRDNQGLQRILLKYLIKVEQITPDHRVCAYDKDFQNKIQFQLGQLKTYQNKQELYKRMLTCYQ